MNNTIPPPDLGGGGGRAYTPSRCGMEACASAERNLKEKGDRRETKQQCH